MLSATVFLLQTSNFSPLAIHHGLRTENKEFIFLPSFLAYNCQLNISLNYIVLEYFILKVVLVDDLGFI